VSLQFLFRTFLDLRSGRVYVVCPIFLDNTLFFLEFQGLSDEDDCKSKYSLIVAGPRI